MLFVTDLLTDVIFYEDLLYMLHVKLNVMKLEHLLVNAKMQLVAHLQASITLSAVMMSHHMFYLQLATTGVRIS